MAAQSGKSSVPSGWYPDPNNSAINRWWSGTEWTRDVSPREAAGEIATKAAAQLETRASSLANEARSTRDAFENPVATARSAAARTTSTASTSNTASRATATPRPNSAASYAASSARPSAPAAPFRPPARSRPAPEIMQPPYAFNRTMSTFALIAVVVGLGLIAGLLLN